jgi:uncharacterized protein YdhG (YjbR/CyaY superfamily)
MNNKNTMSAIFKTIDAYISSFPKEAQEILEQVRQTIKKIALKAEETISYGIPTFKLNGSYLVYFAAFKNHIGFTLLLQGTKHLKKHYQRTNKEKGLFSFH